MFSLQLDKESLIFKNSHENHITNQSYNGQCPSLGSLDSDQNKSDLQGKHPFLCSCCARNVSQIKKCTRKNCATIFSDLNALKINFDIWHAQFVD